MMHKPSRLVRFWQDRRGATAIIFSISSFLLIAAVGLSVDGARIYAAQQRLQSAIDGAVLAAARRAALDGNEEQVQTTFNNYLASAPIISDISVRTVVPDLSRPRRVAAEAIADVPTFILPVLGYSRFEVHAFAAVEFGFTKLEIALALDNTGSMSGTKLTVLKDSATRLVDNLLDKSPSPDAVRFALVPFGQYVNVGLGNRSAPWLSVPDDYSSSSETCGDERPVLSSTNCRTVSYTYTVDGREQTGSYQECDNTYGDPVYQCRTSTSTYTWRGCVGSRAYPLDVQDTGYATRIPGILNASCSSPIQPLTSDRSVLHNAIDAMSATGNTYIPAGVSWGARVLSKTEPYSESAGDRRDASGDSINKILILMTDGANTLSPTYPDHTGSDVSRANQLTAEACAAAKATGITIFTIAFDVSDNSVKTLLRNCATQAGNFFDAADTAQLDASMQAIGQQLGALRITN
jgi:hypothetical protein